uniref:RE1-silencing transcription factor n=2 Tax=Lygus hesperus TaxID=30085 RepID=A0A146KU23_LYGHE
MSSDSSSECTQEEMPLAEVKIEPDSDSDNDSHDPLSVLVESESSCDPLSSADNTRSDHAGDPLSPAQTAAASNEPLPGEQTSTNKPEDEDSMSDLIEETSCDPLSPSNKTKSDPPEDPLNSSQASHNVPTLIGLLGKNGTVIENRIVYVPKLNPLPAGMKSLQLKPSAGDEGSSDIAKVSGPSRKYTCLRCGFQTDMDNELRDHMKTMHPEGLKTDYQKKTQKGAVTKPLKCFLCNTYFPKEDMLNVHLARQHPVTQVEEQNPPKTYSGPRPKSKTSESKAEYKELQNPGPGAKLAKELKEEYKVLLKAGTRHACEHCDFSTFKYSHFVKHQKTHDAKKKPYACDVCGFASYKKIRLKQHRQVKHGISPDSEQCDSTTVELESSAKDADAEIDLPHKKNEKRPFITGDT